MIREDIIKCSILSHHQYDNPLVSSRTSVHASSTGTTALLAELFLTGTRLLDPDRDEKFPVLINHGSETVG